MMSTENFPRRSAGAGMSQEDVRMFARSPTVILLVMRLAYPKFVSIEGRPFFCGPEWEDDIDEFVRFVRRQLQHARWQKTAGQDRERLFADIAEVDLSVWMDPYIVDADGSGRALDEVAEVFKYTWADALHRQYAPATYEVSVVPFSADDLDGPYLRYEKRSSDT